MESSIQIEERAGQWLARRDSGQWSEADEAAFNAWLEQSTLHTVAFVRLEAAWKKARRLKALSAGLPPRAVPSPEEWRLASFFRGVLSSDIPALSTEATQPGSKAARRLPWRLPAVAAGVVLAIAAGIGYYIGSADATYRTAVGGTASVPMSDGSKVMLNTNTRIRVAVSETERRVELQQGEAFFDVAQDPNRPFVVMAGDKRIVVVGTAFSVRRDKEDVRVLVTEGRVRIDGAEDAIPAGAVARASKAGVLVQEKTVPEVERYLSWRTGYLTFRNAPLEEAVAEFNRYNLRQIVIADPSVAQIRISGKFRSTQFEAFVRLMEEGFPIRAEEADGQIMLSSRR